MDFAEKQVEKAENKALTNSGYSPLFWETVSNEQENNRLS